MLSNKKGQALTEFMLIISILVLLVLAHTQFSLNYVASHIMRYATFMGARAEAVWPGSGASANYVEAMVGTEQRPRLGFVARPTSPPASLVDGETIRLQFQTFKGAPGVASISPVSVSPFRREPTPNEVIDQVLGMGGELDNVIALPQN